MTGDRGVRPEPRLRAARDRLQLTQEDVAERLAQLAWYRDRTRVGVSADMVSKWERGLKRPSRLYQGLLCQLFDATAEDLGLRRTPDLPVGDTALGSSPAPPGGQLLLALGEHGRLLLPQLARRWEDDLVQRRELLKAMGLVSLAAALPGVLLPPGGPSGMGARELTADRDTLDGFEALAARYQQLYHLTAPRVLLEPVVAHLQATEDLLRTAPTAARRRLLANHSQVATLAGRLCLFDLHDPLPARGYFGTAYDAALAAGDPVLAAVALGHSSFIPAGAGQPSAAADHLRRARSHTPTTAHPVVHSWLAAVTSEMHASVGDHTAAARAVDEARSLLDAPAPGPPPAWFDFYDATRLNGFEGYSLLRAGRPAHAARPLAAALAGLPANAGKQRAVFQIDLASVRVADGELEEGCRLASDAATGLTRQPYATATARLRDFRAGLRPYRHTRPVRTLDHQLAAL